MTSPASTGLPPRAHRYVLAVVCAGAVVFLGAGATIDVASHQLDGLTVVVLFVLGVASTLLPLTVHARGSTQGFDITIGVAVGLASVVPDVVAVPLVALMALVGSAIRTRSVLKSAFNAGQEVLTVAAAVLAGRLVLGGDLGGAPLADRHALAVVAAVAVGVVVNSVLMTELFARLRDQPRRVVGDAFRLAPFVALLGDTIVALLIGVLAERSSLALLLAAPLFVGLMFGYRGIEASRQAGRRARLLHATSRALLVGAVDDGSLRSAVDGLRELLGARVSRLVMDGDEVTGTLRAPVRTVRRLGRSVLVTEDGGVVAAPVVLDGHVLGVLVVAGREGLDEWDEADVELLSTVADEVASLLRARRLLADVEQERASLAAESQRLGDILHGASDGILLLDDRGRVEACNPAMGDVVGRSSQEVIGRRWDDVLRLEGEDGAPRHAAADDRFSRAMAGAGHAVAELRLRQSDGGWRWLRCSVAPVDRDGQLVGVVLVAVDLTTQRRVDELRGDFLATVSHELRTPLTPLKGFLAVLAHRGSELSADRLAMVHDAMGQQLDRLEDLIGDLLHVAELDGRDPTVDLRVLRLRPLVDEVVASVAGDADARDRVVLAVEDVEVVADRVALRRVLRALLSNGIKHTDGEVVVRTTVADDRLVVDVCDEGPGIPAADRELVFEPFRRLGNHLHRTQGPGLGLAIGRSLAEAMGGSLELVADRAVGACFRLSLPHGEHVRERPAARSWTGVLEDARQV